MTSCFSPPCQMDFYASSLITRAVLRADLLGRAIHHHIHLPEQVLQRPGHAHAGVFHGCDGLCGRGVHRIAALGGQSNPVISHDIRHADQLHV